MGEFQNRITDKNRSCLICNFSPSTEKKVRLEDDSVNMDSNEDIPKETQTSDAEETVKKPTPDVGKDKETEESREDKRQEREEKTVHFSAEATSSIEPALRKLIDGYAVPIKTVDIGSEKLGKFVPVTKKTVCYIVAAVIINDAGQILMMQEAKYSCHGSWYLPAGRVERGESLYEACQREVEEETGLKCEPQTLIAVEFGSGCWYRFTFTGRVTGGKLKTLEDKDKESLQAEWIDYENIKNKFLQLRAKDVIPLIKIGLHYKAKLPHLKHSPLLPVQQAHKHLINRPVVVKNLKESDIQILVNIEGGDHLPSGYDNNRVFSAIITPYSILTEAFGRHQFKPRQCGLLNVEYNSSKGSELYGCCITTLISLDIDDTPKPKNENYKWARLKDAKLCDDFSRFFKEGMIVPFIDLQH